ncbi:MAG: hypothetical protein F6K36_29435 [Symploca sp. SIO3C6]|nr:hypothetical protein [Symploca sp. SIO3C6]
MNWKKDVVKVVAVVALLFSLVLSTTQEVAFASEIEQIALASELQPQKPPQLKLEDTLSTGSPVSISALCYTCGGTFPEYVTSISTGATYVVEYGSSCGGESELRPDSVPYLCRDIQ